MYLSWASNLWINVKNIDLSVITTLNQCNFCTRNWCWNKPQIMWSVFDKFCWLLCFTIRFLLLYCLCQSVHIKCSSVKQHFYSYYKEQVYNKQSCWVLTQQYEKQHIMHPYRQKCPSFSHLLKTRVIFSTMLIFLLSLSHGESAVMFLQLWKQALTQSVSSCTSAYLFNEKRHLFLLQRQEARSLAFE